MEPIHSTISMMHMFPHPVFQVKEGIIADMNQAARQLGIPENVPIRELLATGQEVYENLTDGCLSLTLSIHNTDFLATVIRAADGDVFHLETHHGESSRLCALALAASQLKQARCGGVITGSAVSAAAVMQRSIAQRASAKVCTLYSVSPMPVIAIT